MNEAAAATKQPKVPLSQVGSCLQPATERLLRQHGVVHSKCGCIRYVHAQLLQDRLRFVLSGAHDDCSLSTSMHALSIIVKM